MLSLGNIKIKDPKQKNIEAVVNIFNGMKGEGIEIFYDIKKGKIFVADYFQNFNAIRIKKLSIIYEGSRRTNITTEYVLNEIKKIKKNELNSRIAAKNSMIEEAKLRKAQKKNRTLKQAKPNA